MARTSSYARRSWTLRGLHQDYRLMLRWELEAREPRREVDPGLFLWQLPEWRNSATATLREIFEALGGHLPEACYTSDAEQYAQLIEERLTQAFRSGELIAFLTEEAPARISPPRVLPAPTSPAGLVQLLDPRPVAAAASLVMGSKDVDAVAQARVLRESAQKGTPFCEQCQKRGSARAA